MRLSFIKKNSAKKDNMRTALCQFFSLIVLAIACCDINYALRRCKYISVSFFSVSRRSTAGCHLTQRTCRAPTRMRKRSSLRGLDSSSPSTFTQPPVTSITGCVCFLFFWLNPWNASLFNFLLNNQNNETRPCMASLASPAFPTLE